MDLGSLPAWPGLSFITPWTSPARPWGRLLTPCGEIGRSCGSGESIFPPLGEFGMDYMEQEDRSFVPLSVDLERLEVTPEYRQKALGGVFRI